MKICILYDSYAQSSSVLKEVDLPGDPTPYLVGHDWERVVIHKATAVQQVIELSKRGFDVFINLCDGAWDEDRPGIEVVQALERLGQAFTGATPAFFEPSRETMKRVGHYWGVRAPAYRFVAGDAEIDEAAQSLHFPLIVKHPSSYSSIGMTRESRVTRAEDLGVQAWKIIDAFGSALIEEFIEGREFTVLVAENPDDEDAPIAYQPIEFCFPPGESFKHFDMKWVTYHDMKDATVTDPVLCERLKEMSRRLFLGLDGKGYGRCDIRMDADGELYMLEINPNCGIFYFDQEAGSADLCLLRDSLGHPHFVDTILRTALKRAHREQKPWQLRLDAAGGYGMVAVRQIDTDEVIEPYEERPHVLVTRQHVLSTWPEQKRRWFAQYAYPLSDEVYVLWSNDPEEWRPLNHSCDPNGWLNGLNLVARRSIAPGEAITVDYATFCNEISEEFICTCGATECRGVVRGSDHLAPFLARYGEHISDYVRMKRLPAPALSQEPAQALPAGFRG